MRSELQLMIIDCMFTSREEEVGIDGENKGEGETVLEKGVLGP